MVFQTERLCQRTATRSPRTLRIEGTNAGKPRIVGHVRRSGTGQAWRCPRECRPMQMVRRTAAHAATLLQASAPATAAYNRQHPAAQRPAVLAGAPSRGALKPSAPGGGQPRTSSTVEPPGLSPIRPIHKRTRQGGLEAEGAQSRPDLAENAHQVKGQCVEACGQSTFRKRSVNR